MQIIPAAEHNVSEIDALIARSKAHWDWDPAYLAATLPMMAVSPAYLRENLCFELRDGGTLAGFMSVKDEPGVRLLDNLWIQP